MPRPKYFSPDIPLSPEQVGEVRRIYNLFANPVGLVRLRTPATVLDDAEEIARHEDLGYQIKLQFVKLLNAHLAILPPDYAPGWYGLVDDFIKSNAAGITGLLRVEEDFWVFKNFCTNLTMNIQSMVAQTTGEEDDFLIRTGFTPQILGFMSNKDKTGYPQQTLTLALGLRPLGYLAMSRNGPEQEKYLCNRVADDIMLLLYLAQKNFDIDLQEDVYRELAELYSMQPTQARLSAYMADANNFQQDAVNYTIAPSSEKVTLEMRLERVKTNLLKSLGNARVEILREKVAEYFELLCAQLDVATPADAANIYFGGGRAVG